MTERAIFELALSKRNKLAEKILEQIATLANNDEKEIERINQAYRWLTYHDLKSRNKELDLEADGLSPPTGKTPSIAEQALSLGLVSLNLAIEQIIAEDINETFEMLLLASEMLGCARGCSTLNELKAIEKSLFYKNAALKRHAENYAIKADALKYYAENIATFKSMDAAAEIISKEIVPASFRAVRKWISEYHKHLRSAGTA